MDYHLTTLFPPVRPRRWLEIRYLDALSDDLWPAVVFTLVSLLDDARLSEIAWEATESVATAWDQAARVGWPIRGCEPRPCDVCKPPPRSHRLTWRGRWTGCCGR